MLILSSILITNVTSQTTDIDFQTFLNDYDEPTMDFASYDIDDSVLVKDKIEDIHYFGDEVYETEIWLESTGSNPEFSQSLKFKSDLTDDYKKGEKIEIEFTIIATPDGMGEDYYFDKDDIYHITIIEVKEEKHGIEILGFHREFPDYLKSLDNNYGRFLVQFLIWVFIAIIVLVILDPIIKKATEKSETKIDDIILQIIRKPILILIILYGVVVSLRELELPSEFMYWVEGAYSIGFFLMMIWIGYKVFQGVLLQIGHALAKRTTAEVDKTLVPAIQKIGTIAIAFIAFSAILGYLQIDLTLFVAGGVVISMVIAFAAQDTLSNFFAGLFLILEPKFKEGDLIYFEGDTFEVKKIGMRTTQLYDLYKHIEVVMPNNKLANEKLINITEPDRRIKDSVEIGVAYGTDPQKVQDILMEIVMKHPDVITDDADRKPFTRFSEFGDSSLNFKIGFWVLDLDDRFRVKSEINQELYYRLAKENIEIPFPQRDVHLYEHKA
jgi:small-conductance mechanosensitive channel